jgi:hypothetical protein
MRATRVWEGFARLPQPPGRRFMDEIVVIDEQSSRNGKGIPDVASVDTPLNIELGARSSKLPLHTHRLANLCP